MTVPTMPFPKDPCYICTKPIRSVDAGYVFVSDAQESLDSLFEIESPLIPAFTHQLLKQFPDQFRQSIKTRYEGGAVAVNVGDYVLETLKLANSTYRLDEARRGVFSGSLYMVVHDECCPDDSVPFFQYTIGLERINEPLKAIDWTIQLSEKYGFRATGWAQILESLFGRRGV